MNPWWKPNIPSERFPVGSLVFGRTEHFLFLVSAYGPGPVYQDAPDNEYRIIFIMSLNGKNRWSRHAGDLVMIQKP